MGIKQALFKAYSDSLNPTKVGAISLYIPIREIYWCFSWSMAFVNAYLALSHMSSAPVLIFTQHVIIIGTFSK